MIGLAGLPIVLGLPLWGVLVASRISLLGDAAFIVGPAVNFVAVREIARRHDWPRRASRRLAIASAVVTALLPALVILLALVVFVVGCRGDRCFTF